MLVTLGMALLLKKIMKEPEFVKKLKKKILWNSVIRGQIQYYFPVALIVFGSFKSGVPLVSLFKLACLLTLPIFSFFHLRKNFDLIENKEFGEKYDTLYQNLYPLKPTVYQMTTIFCIKRLLFALSTVYLAEFVVPHMYVYIFVPLFFLGFSLNNRPYKSRMLNFKENMNESLVLICAYFIPLFT